MALASRTACPECLPESSGPIPTRQRELISEMLSRLDDAVLAGTPVFAQQRMLSDLSVCASLLVRSRSVCSIGDAEFLRRLSVLEATLAQNRRGLDLRNLEEIRGWFAARFEASRAETLKL